MCTCCPDVSQIMVCWGVGESLRPALLERWVAELEEAGLSEQQLHDNLVRWWQLCAA
jgi:hypothetical protein